MSAIVADHRPDGLSDGHGGNGHAAATVSRVRSIVNDVALLVWRIHQTTISAGIDARRRGRQVLHLRACAREEGRSHRELKESPPGNGNAHGLLPLSEGLCQTTATGFSNLPMPEMVMRTASSGSSVNESGGTTPAPVSSTAPLGNSCERNKYSTSSVNVRLICPARVSPANTITPRRSISS